MSCCSSKIWGNNTRLFLEVVWIYHALHLLMHVWEFGGQFSSVSVRDKKRVSELGWHAYLPVILLLPQTWNTFLSPFTRSESVTAVWSALTNRTAATFVVCMSQCAMISVSSLWLCFIGLSKIKSRSQGVKGASATHFSHFSHLAFAEQGISRCWCHCVCRLPPSCSLLWVHSVRIILYSVNLPTLKDITLNKGPLKALSLNTATLWDTGLYTCDGYRTLQPKPSGVM